jgi:hypothetical protein
VLTKDAASDFVVFLRGGVEEAGVGAGSMVWLCRVVCATLCVEAAVRI